MNIGVARIVTAVAIVVSIVAAARAQDQQDLHALSRSSSFYAATERLGYYGTVSVYSTLKDARQEKHARFSKQVFPQRDGSLFVVKNAPAYFSDSDAFLTNWYDDAASDNGGTGNPNNTDLGFIQLYDGINDPPTTVRNSIGFWDRDHDTFTVEVAGQNATYPNTFARLWNAGSPDVGGEGTTGTFVAYQYKLRAYGLSAVNQGNGFYTSTNNPSSYSGSFYAIFQNLSTTSPESNGFYVVHLWFDSASWAASNGFALNDEFGSNIVRKGDDDSDGD
jgi:hypothetical protein